MSKVRCVRHILVPPGQSLLSDIFNNLMFKPFTSPGDSSLSELQRFRPFLRKTPVFFLSLSLDTLPRTRPEGRFFISKTKMAQLLNFIILFSFSRGCLYDSFRVPPRHRFHNAYPFLVSSALVSVKGLHRFDKIAVPLLLPFFSENRKARCASGFHNPLRSEKFIADLSPVRWKFYVAEMSPLMDA